MATVSGKLESAPGEDRLDFCPSETRSLKTSVEPALADAANVGLTVVLLGTRVTAAPTACCQSKVMASPSGSKLLLPSSVAIAPSFIVESSPASATGGLFTLTTVTSTVSASLWLTPSSTMS